MLYHLLYPLSDAFQLFNLFQYLTVRSGGAMMTAFVLSLLFGPKLIKTFKAWQHGAVTTKAVLGHDAKQGTPTMGGIMIVCTFLISAMLWARWDNPLTWLVVGTGVLFGAIGLADDLLTCRPRKAGTVKKRKEGLSGKVRLGLQALISVALVTIAFQYFGDMFTTLYPPFFKDMVIPLGVLGFSAFAFLVLAGSANGVNLTDGLDGLVSIPAAVVASTLAILAYITGRVDFTEYLSIPYIYGAGEITVLLAGLVGGILGFLWFNAPPAKIFMGDTGSLAIGGILGASALLIKQEFTLLIVGAIFVVEALSSILQIASFKLRGKRIFLMAPLHHHFEKKGMPESRIVVRFWIVQLLLALFALATLKLR